ncbi:SRP-independent targeting protein 3 [[Candida] jaroonii]|uniref:SRP-independent targeting protein 3 n=1 Tax=[Candida] jaroonii TaxID=467808 RepID=A0ACA9YCF9_9ASCO|nr:SRP-independent targeting protein 3 [[Candida] jaroonii]
MFGVSPAVSNIVIMLVMMQVSRRLDLENPDILFYVRVIYGSLQALTFFVFFLTRLKINSKNDLTTLKYVEPANPMSGETAPRAVVTTVKEYDLKQIDTQIRGIFQSLAMMGFMHLYLKYTNPLVMQSISGIKGALESNIVQIHLFGAPATGDLKRPFKAAPGLLQALTGAGEIQTDKASVEKAEVSGAGGIKED